MAARSILSVSAVLAAISVIAAGLVVLYLRGSEEGREKQSSLPVKELVAASDALSVRVVYPVPPGSARQISVSQNEPSK